jgi:hypothetical protein
MVFIDDLWLPFLGLVVIRADRVFVAAVIGLPHDQVLE